MGGGGPTIQCHPWQHSEFEVSLDYTRPLKEREKEKEKLLKKKKRPFSGSHLEVTLNQSQVFTGEEL